VLWHVVTHLASGVEYYCHEEIKGKHICKISSLTGTIPISQHESSGRVQKANED
jgi:hypothetical protein